MNSRQRHGTAAARAHAMYLDLGGGKQEGGGQSLLGTPPLPPRGPGPPPTSTDLCLDSGSGLVLSTATLRPRLRAPSVAATQRCHEPSVS